MNYEVTVLEYGKYIQAIEWLRDNVSPDDWWQTYIKESNNEKICMSSNETIEWFLEVKSFGEKSFTMMKENNDPMHEQFVFKNSNDALLFKLKWG